MASTHVLHRITLCAFLFMNISLSAVSYNVVYQGVKCTHLFFDKIDPTGLLIGNDTKEWLAKYLIFRINGKEIKRGEEIFVDIHGDEITISLSFRPEVFNSKGQNDGSQKINFAGKLKSMVALMHLAKDLSEKVGIVNSTQAKGVGLFIRVKVNPAQSPICLGDILLEKIKLWLENPPKMIISIEEGIELIDC